MLKIVTRNKSSKLMDAGRQMNLVDRQKVSNDDNVELSEVVVIRNIPPSSNSASSNRTIEPMTYQAEQHINLLMSKSYCGHDVHENESTREHILNAYKFLNSNPFLSCILMIVASSSKVKSVYDFKRDSVHIADPTVPSNTKGMFYLSGRVYIGAKQLLDESEKTEVYSTLAHEFCHYAMDLTYKNFAKPYAKYDNKTRQEFEEISQKCQQQQGFEEYIDIVYEHYPPEVQHAELIVRVPHLIALYSDQPERLREVREKFIELFEFYENKIFIEMQEALPKIEKLDQLEHEKKAQKILKLRKIACFSFIFTLFAIILVIALTCLLNKKQIYNFNELSETYKLKITNAPIIYKNIEIRFNNLFPDNSKAYYKLTSDHISQIVEGHALNFSDPHLSYLNDLVHHDWGNLTEKLKYKFLTSNFTFQNESLKFGRLEEINSEVFNSLRSEQIVDVLDGKKLIVGKMIEDQIDYYIERKFMVEDVKVTGGKYRIENEDERKAMEIRLEGDQVEELVYTEGSKEVTQKPANGLDSLTNFEYQITKIDKNSIQNSDEIIQEALEDRIFILSSDIGAGKTVIFQNLTIRLKKSYPTKWVSFIDLNNQIVCDNLKKLDKNLENNESIENLVQFLSNILNLDRNNKFEAALLEKSFKLGNVVLFWDNFDLLSSENREIITKNFNLIYKLTQNVQFISSLPLFINQLKQSLNAKIYHPVPFTESEQKDYFRSFFNLKNLSKEKVENFTQGAFNISKTLQLDSPLMQRFIADIYESDKLYENRNFYNLILKFVTQKIEVWIKTSDTAKTLTNHLFSRSSDNFDMMKMYQKVAFEKELGFTKPEDWYENLAVLKTKIPKILQVDEIARMGILSYKSKTDYNFIHKTLADFFLAKYFIDNLYNKDNNVSENETELRNRAFKFLLDERREMVVTLIREYLKDNIDDRNINHFDFLQILNAF